MSPDSSPASRPVEILQGLPAREYIGSHRQSGWLNDGMPAVLIAMTFHEDRRAPCYPPSGPAIPFLWAVGLQRAAHLSNGMSLSQPCSGVAGEGSRPEAMEATATRRAFCCNHLKAATKVQIPTSPTSPECRCKNGHSGGGDTWRRQDPVVAGHPPAGNEGTKWPVSPFCLQNAGW